MVLPVLSLSGDDMNIDSEIGRARGKISHAKTKKDKAKLRAKLSDLNRAKLGVRRKHGSQKDVIEIENSYRDISGLDKL